MDITVSDEVSQEYHELVKNILCNREFLKLSLYTHHQWTTRLMHSINVSYLSWFIARKLGCDEKAAARAGLLHDFCPYDFKAETPTGEHQAFYHPKAAADNSAAHFDVTDRELDAILSHMFPLGPLPRNKEAWIISFADKACAIAEGCIGQAEPDRHQSGIISTQKTGPSPLLTSPVFVWKFILW